MAFGCRRCCCWCCSFLLRGILMCVKRVVFFLELPMAMRVRKSKAHCLLGIGSKARASHSFYGYIWLNHTVFCVPFAIIVVRFFFTHEDKKRPLLYPLCVSRGMLTIGSFHQLNNPNCGSYTTSNAVQIIYVLGNNVFCLFNILALTCACVCVFHSIWMAVQMPPFWWLIFFVHARVRVSLSPFI